MRLHGIILGVIVVFLAIGAIVEVGVAFRDATGSPHAVATSTAETGVSPEITTENSSSLTPPAENLVEPLITVSSPVPFAQVGSPLSVTGEARGYWYFEASFPVLLLDANGQTLAQGVAEAQGDWMTENFVPFAATLTFGTSTTATGTLRLLRDNPSGLPENDAHIEVPVIF